jgi:hypothetical protein
MTADDTKCIPLTTITNLTTHVLWAGRRGCFAGAGVAHTRLGSMAGLSYSSLLLFSFLPNSDEIDDS